MALKTMPLNAFLNQRGRKPTTNPNRYYTNFNRALAELVLLAGGQVEFGYITPPEIKPMPFSEDYLYWQVAQDMNKAHAMSKLAGFTL